MDKNQATGLLLISALLIGYLYFFGNNDEPTQETSSSEQVQPEQKTTEPSGIKEEAVLTPDTMPEDTIMLPYGELMAGESKAVFVETDELKIEFNSKGGNIESAQLKNYKTYEGEPLYLLGKETSSMSMLLKDREGEILDLYQVNFESTVEEGEIEGKTFKKITFNTEYGGSPIKQSYTLVEGSYEIEYSVDLGALGKEMEDQANLLWFARMIRSENVLEQSRNQTSVNYYTLKEDFEDVTNSNDEEKVEEAIQESFKWFSLKQRFFNAGLISPNSFPAATFSSEFDAADSSYVKDQMATVAIPISDLMGGEKPFRFYLGPNNYQILKKVEKGYGNNVYLGWTVFATVNKYTVVPFFNLLEQYISNYGLLILILVIVVKVILSPLSYRSYKSMAKMKVLRPEIDEIKERIGDDQQKVQMETMKLYQQFGVNPLSGCVPVVLQIPVLFALFNFFPNSIELRQQSFLWADDLSTYDSILDLPFSIPFYGDHVSLFTLLMTVSTIAYTYVQNQGNPMQQQGPMKTMQYFFPIMIMFFLNNFSAGLTYYYFLSNVITIGQQFLIRKFVNEDEIRNKLEANHKRKKTKGKSKLQERIESAMNTQSEGSTRAMRRQGKKK